MGIKGLGQLLGERCSKDTWGDECEMVPLHKLDGHTVVIDLLNVYHPIVVTSYDIHIKRDPTTIPVHNDVTRTANGLLVKNVLEPLVSNGVTPVIVCDGNATKMKSATQKNRRKTTEKYADQQVEAEIRLEKLRISHSTTKEEPLDEEEKNTQLEEMLIVNSEMVELNKRIVTAIKGSVRISDSDKESVRTLADRLGIPFIVAPSEAEKYCAQLVREGHAIAAFGNDTDLYVHGCNMVITKIKDNHARVVFLHNILTQLELSYNAFVDLCIMLGTDYNNNVPKFGPKRCYELIRHYGSLDAMPKLADTSCIKSKGGKVNEKLPPYEKALLRNEDTGQDWQEIRREFTEGRANVDSNKLLLDECDINNAKELLGWNDVPVRFTSGHTKLMNSKTYKIPYLEWFVGI
jgi:5'-3' exonuclease